MDVQKEISLRNAISHCIKNNDTNTATNRIMELIRDIKEAISVTNCSRCKLPFTKEELQVNEHCCNCGQEMQEIAINKEFFCGEKDEGNQENQCDKQCGICAYIDKNFTK